MYCCLAERQLLGIQSHYLAVTTVGSCPYQFFFPIKMQLLGLSECGGIILPNAINGIIQNGICPSVQTEEDQVVGPQS